MLVWGQDFEKGHPDNLDFFFSQRLRGRSVCQKWGGMKGARLSMRMVVKILSNIEGDEEGNQAVVGALKMRL